VAGGHGATTPSRLTGGWQFLSALSGTANDRAVAVPVRPDKGVADDCPGGSHPTGRAQHRGGHEVTAIKAMSLAEVKAEIVFMALSGGAVLAAEEWRRRGTGQSRPDGTWDNANRYYPSDTERETCCTAIRTPSRAFPYSLWRHAHSHRHVAAKFGTSASELRRAASLLIRRDELTAR
jgi:hypothetical protein